MKNFGLSHLALVRCSPHQVQEAYSLGWNAKEILEGAEVFYSLDDALKDSVLVVGLTRRSGHSRGEPRSFLEILPHVMETASDHEVSLLFGNEKNGLSNEELRRCHFSAAFPANPEYGSLNLSHAVAIASFLIFSRTAEAELSFRKPERLYATMEEMEDLMRDFKEALEILGYRDEAFNDLLTRTLHNLRRLFKKAGLERREFHLLKAFLSRTRQGLTSRDHLRSSQKTGSFSGF